MKAERNRAMRIAYGHARAGRERFADRWLEVARSFSNVEPSQERHLARLVTEAGGVHPGQLRLVDPSALVAELPDEMRADATRGRDQ